VRAKFRPLAPAVSATRSRRARNAEVETSIETASANHAFNKIALPVTALRQGRPRRCRKYDEIRNEDLGDSVGVKDPVAACPHIFAVCLHISGAESSPSENRRSCRRSERPRARGKSALRQIRTCWRRANRSERWRPASSNSANAGFRPLHLDGANSRHRFTFGSLPRPHPRGRQGRLSQPDEHGDTPAGRTARRASVRGDLPGRCTLAPARGTCTDFGDDCACDGSIRGAVPGLRDLAGDTR
jgi:hypothetical protein